MQNSDDKEQIEKALYKNSSLIEEIIKDDINKNTDIIDTTKLEEDLKTLKFDNYVVDDTNIHKEYNNSDTTYIITLQAINTNPLNFTKAYHVKTDITFNLTNDKNVKNYIVSSAKEGKIDGSYD